MLSPQESRVVLLPEDRELIKLLGCSESEYKDYIRFCRAASKIRPGTPVAIGLDIILLQIGIALVLSAAAYFLTPKPKTQRRGASAQLESVTVDGQSIVQGNRYAPKAGFDQLQNVVEMGSVVPLVYAHRETINGIDYGGVRVNTNLLWSQVLSLGGDQLLRGLFLVGEGDTRPNSMEIDPGQFAFGNNLLGSYDLNPTATQSRVSIYYTNDGGRITNADHIAGRIPANDPGNATNFGGADVFEVRGANGQYGPNFCYAYKPSTQTSIGLFAWIGNGVAYKTNPSLRPAWSPTLVPTGSPDRLRVACSENGQEVVRRLKDEFNFPGQSGIMSGAGNVVPGDLITYGLDPGVSRADDFVYTVGGNVVGTATSELSSNDANSAVAGRQNSFDENLVIGELYRIGSALAVCIDRTGQRFVSQAEPGGGQGVNATFEVVRAGVVAGTGTGATGSVTSRSQIFRISIGSFVTEYPCQVLEIGLRSTLGVSISGVTNTTEVNSDYGSIDQAACIAHNGNNVANNQTLVVQNFQAGTVTKQETRYSFFRIRVRVAGTNNAYEELPDLFGVRNDSGQPTYNYLRFEMPQIERWEFELEPVSSWEIRSQTAQGLLQVMDARIGQERVVTQTVGTLNMVVRYRGLQISRGLIFDVPLLNPVEPRLWFDGNNRADRFIKIAEATSMNEVSTTVGGNPEHELVYVNTILPNSVAPNYEDLAYLGMNIRASREFANLAQFSVYVNRGLGGFHDFPSVLRDVLTNDRYGVGQIVSPEQIDEPSFVAATTFTRARRYFFDGAISQPINLRQWGTATARDFLLDFVIRNGRFALQPIVEFDAAEPITGFFTSGNIVEDTFELSYFDQDQRQPPRVSVKWREEKRNGTAATLGLFPVVREVTVREAGVPADAPLEQIDMSDFCTSEVHAVDRAKFECRFRRTSTHQVRFTTTTDQAALQLGKCFKLGMETLTYDQPTNGYIARDGTVTSWPELADGTYDVLSWDGTGAAVVETRITVSSGRATGVRGAVFCLADRVQETQVYKVQSLSFNEEGNIEVEAIHWPVNEVGVSNIADGWNVDGNWVIEGEIGDTDSPIELSPDFESVSIMGPNVAVVGEQVAYSAIVNGPDGNYTYNWTPNGTPDDESITRFTFTAADLANGGVILEVEVTLNGVTQTATKAVQVVAGLSLGIYEYDAVTGTEDQATVNTAKEYDITATTAGTVTDQLFSHSCIAAPAGTQPGAVVILNTADTVGGETIFSSASYTFPAAGDYTIQCIVSSPTANTGTPLTLTQQVTVT